MRCEDCKWAVSDSRAGLCSPYKQDARSGCEYYCHRYPPRVYATDDTGAFTGYVRPGKVGISLYVPDGYATPAMVPREVGEETTWPTSELEPKPPAAPGVKVSGVVVNEMGQPVPAATALGLGAGCRGRCL